MSEELSKLNFADDLSELRELPEAKRWKIENPADLELQVVVYPIEKPEETFLARLFWMDYPGTLPPSVKFIDPATGRLDVITAWPEARGFRPGSLDICANWTAEGYRAHTEWLNDPSKRWRSEGNVMLAAMRTLQDELDLTFSARARG